MVRSAVIISVSILTIFFSCTEERKFPEVKKLSEYKETEFIPTLEHKVSKDKNSVYCATLLFAWNEIKNQISSPLTIPNNYTDLKLLNESTSFENVLKKEEYKTTGLIEGLNIIAKAEFAKSLPFEFKLRSFDSKLKYGEESVYSFGILGHDKRELLDLVPIAYYKNDKNFVIKLLPMDKDDEVILFKTEKSFSTISDMIVEIERLTKIGKNEKLKEQMLWKYIYNEEDEVIIPKFKFNIETNYIEFEGKDFYTKEESYEIQTAWQRTAFILDELGAEMESESIVIVESVDSIAEVELPKPKKMIFDSPFLTLLKRRDSKNPYFALWTTNAELMIK